ncbi:MAG TPA: fasciclin domain-containing protein [Dermatophilaceae bacterium]|nr:fasciclin domain-containing protein [Dermatophilaceae bacterium]
MIRKTIAGLTAAAALAAPLALAAPAQADASKKSIADVLLSDKAGDDSNGFDKNWYDFDIVTEAALALGLGGAVSDPNQSLTVFAPNDRAFQVLVADLTGKWLSSEKGIFDILAANPALGTVLKYHVVKGKISASDALKSDGAQPETLLGSGPSETFEVDVVSRTFQFIVLKDEDKNDFNPWIVRSKFNVGGELSNGYIHGIGLVLRPVDLP